MTYLIATEPNFTRYDETQLLWLRNNIMLSSCRCYSSLQGLTVVWEPLLGYALIGLTSRTWECLTLPLDEPKKIPYDDNFYVI